MGEKDMRDPKLKRLKIAKNLLDVADSHLPQMKCDSLYQCKACDTFCRAGNIVRAARYWIDDAIRILDMEEKHPFVANLPIPHVCPSCGDGIFKNGVIPRLVCPNCKAMLAISGNGKLILWKAEMERCYDGE